MATKTSKSNNCFASIAEAESESESDNLNKSVDDIRQARTKQMRRDSRMIEELEKSVDNLNIQQSNNNLDFDLLQEL